MKRKLQNYTKESQIKGELQLVTMSEEINFVSGKFDEFEKDRHEKDKIITNFLKQKQKKLKWPKGLTNYRI